MSVNITPAAQLTIVDPSVNVTPNPLTSGGIAIYCANGVAGQREALLPAATSLLALNFPVGLTTAAIIFVAAITATDLKVNVGGTPFALPVPLGQGLFLYNLTTSQVSVSSVLGGTIQYYVGG